MLLELKAVGYEVDDPSYFVERAKPYKDALPILLKYIPLVEETFEKDVLIRASSVKGNYQAVPVLLDEYKKSSNESLMWTIGNALWLIGDQTIVGQLIELLESNIKVDQLPDNMPEGLQSPEKAAKETLLWALGKTRDPKAIPVLKKYLQVEGLEGHALEGLKYFKDPDLIPFVTPLLTHQKSWVRKNAERFIKSLKRQINMHELCKKLNVACQMPSDETLVAVSEGVFEGDLVQGVRYKMEAHMSGWIITSDRYNGDVSTLRTEHMKHIFEHRPDLVKYLCLPIGWRFDTSRDDFWFDQEII